jgi:hypothetical protein
VADVTACFLTRLPEADRMRAAERVLAVCDLDLGSEEKRLVLDQGDKTVAGALLVGLFTIRDEFERMDLRGCVAKVGALIRKGMLVLIDHRRELPHSPTDELLDTRLGPDGPIRQRQARALLSPGEDDLVREIEGESHTVTEAARKLGLAPNTAHVLAHRIRKKILDPM